MTVRYVLKFTATAVLVFATFGTVTAAGRHLIKRIPVPGDYGWDYASADTEGRRLYVGHVREVVVLDLDTGAVVGSVGGGTNMHGAAVARQFNRGFISQTNPESGSVVIFDLKTLARISDVMVGRDPNLILFDPRTGRVFTADRGDSRLSAIDAKTGRLVGAVENLGGRTEHGASDEKGHIFLNLQDKGLLLRIDAQALTVLDTWSVAPCGQPSAMDMDKEHDRVFIGCRSGVFAAVDGNTGRVITTMPIGPGVDALEFDAAKGLIYVSSGGEGGSLSVFHEDSPDRYSLVEKVTTEAGARTLAVDHKTGHVYLPVGQFAPAPGGTRGRGAMVPGSFHILVFGE
jgi:DNA-binding beta-propeller fold protein YncE